MNVKAMLLYYIILYYIIPDHGRFVAWDVCIRRDNWWQFLYTETRCKKYLWKPAQNREVLVSYLCPDTVFIIDISRICT